MTGYTITSFHDYEETFVVVKQKNCLRISLNLYFKVYQCMKVVELVTGKLKSLKFVERSLKFENIQNTQYWISWIVHDVAIHKTSSLFERPTNSGAFYRILRATRVTAMPICPVFLRIKVWNHQERCQRPWRPRRIRDLTFAQRYSANPFPFSLLIIKL